MTKGKIYLVLQSIVCILLAALLALAAVSVFREGSARKAANPLENVYTPAAAAAAFAPIAPLFFASLGLLAAGLLLGVRDEKAGKPVRDAEISRDLAAARLTAPSEAMKKEQQTQKRLTLIGWGLFALCMVPVAVYLTNPAHFPEDNLEGMIAGLIRVFLPWTAVGLGALAVTGVLRDKSLIRETVAAKAQLKKAPPSPLPKVPEGGKPDRHRGAVQVSLVVLGLFFLVLGVVNGSALDVLIKAISICTECVGLG